MNRDTATCAAAKGLKLMFRTKTLTEEKTSE